MFENLSGRLATVFDRLRGRGALTEADVEAALRDIRVALLEADVALPVVKEFVAGIRERAVGHESEDAERQREAGEQQTRQAGHGPSSCLGLHAALSGDCQPR